MKAWEAQAAIVSTLLANSGVAALVGTRIYDHVPQDATFPYLAVGDSSSAPFDTATTIGSEVSLYVHAWSRYNGRKETKQIQAAIYTALNRSTLGSLTGLIHCEQEMAQDFVDPDGLTRHGVQSFVLQIEET